VPYAARECNGSERAPGQAPDKLVDGVRDADGRDAERELRATRCGCADRSDDAASSATASATMETGSDIGDASHDDDGVAASTRARRVRRFRPL